MLSEATAPYIPPKYEYGLMTVDEFIKHRNPKGKFHDSEAYDHSLADLNRDYSNHLIIANRSRSFGFDEIYKNDNAYWIYKRDHLIALVFDNTLYYSTRFDLSDFPISYDTGREHYEIDADKRVKVKYFDEVVAKANPTAARNEEEFGKFLQRIKVGDFYFTVREQTKDMMGAPAIVILNEEGLIVGMASDEWGATLIRIAKEYRGEGLAKVLTKFWYDKNPDHLSGGFTQSGYENAIKFWADRVRTMLKNGWYDQLVKEGKVSKEKVKEILAGLPERQKPKESKLKKEQNDILIKSDDHSFIIYDKKFFDNPVEKYIYAHGFFRDTNKKLYVFTIGYDRNFKKLANAIILQIAKDEGFEVYDAGPADTIEPEGLPFKRDGDFISLTKDVVPLKQANQVEKAYRMKRDPYSEFYYSLQELADSKFNS